MRWRQQNDKPQKDGYYFIKEGDSGGGRYYFETIGGGQWRWHEYSNCVSEKHKFEWLDESIPADIEQEAERLYPNKYKNGEGGAKGSHYMDFEIAEIKRSAHITAARMYMDTIERLTRENEKMRKTLEAEGYCTMCYEKKKKHALLVCDTCYDSFDGDRRSFWDDNFIH